MLRLRLCNSESADARLIQKNSMEAQFFRWQRVTQGSLFVPTRPRSDKLELTIARIAYVVEEGNVGL